MSGSIGVIVQVLRSTFILNQWRGINNSPVARSILAATVSLIKLRHITYYRLFDLNTMRWLLSITTVTAVMANIVAAAPPSSSMENPLLARQVPLCSSSNDVCFGPSESLDCAGCNADCFSTESGGRCQASCRMRTTTGAGTPVTWCSCEGGCGPG